MANNNENPNGLFREKSIERISSPEDLNDYVKIANPGVWMILLAIVVLLAGFAVWALNGELETTVPAVIVTQDGHTDCYISEQSASKIGAGMVVRCGGEEYKVVGVSMQSLDADDILSDYAMHVSGFKEGEWMHAVILDKTTPEGTFAAEIVTESIKPIKFIVG